MSEATRRALLARIPAQPGVYRMLDAEGRVLYVGKAKELKRRVSSYFSRSLNSRLQVMVARIADIQITLTRTEGEALLLEADLIKAHQPHFNVLLRDGKSYPFIYLSTQERFPRLAFYRGPRKGKGRYFGPYPSASAVRETLHLLQKIFPVRQCRDSFFRNRSRPCLQYQIKRCTAPCVGYIEPEAYGADVERSIKFLDGRTDEVIRELGERMDAAAAALEFEQAATLRDQIAMLRRIQQRQYVTAADGGDLDILACASDGGLHCVQVFFIRGGRNLGNKSFFPQAPADASAATLMAGFLTQFYADKHIPPELLLSAEPEELDFLEAAFSERAGHKVVIKHRLRGDRVQWLKMAQSNADLALQTRLGSRAGYSARLEALRELLALDELPQRMECFDISHTGGELTVASCVVFDAEGPRKSDYRRFNIDGIVPGDDYAAMAQALGRRYQRIKQGEIPLPDLLFIDGGRGQLSAALGILAELGIQGVRLVGVAKGPDRKAGAEQLWQPHQRHAIIAPADSPAMHLVQQIRDEAHRFAITGHRQRRDKARRTSVLEGIPGVGPKRRSNLLKAFGGLHGLRRATAEEIARVDGIGAALAEQIHQAMQQNSV
nr:excinuclease ABC subunit UvrC [Rhabdochromatium marinum]